MNSETINKIKEFIDEQTLEEIPDTFFKMSSTLLEMLPYNFFDCIKNPKYRKSNNNKVVKDYYCLRLYHEQLPQILEIIVVLIELLRKLNEELIYIQESHSGENTRIVVETYLNKMYEIGPYYYTENNIKQEINFTNILINFKNFNNAISNIDEEKENLKNKNTNFNMKIIENQHKINDLLEENPESEMAKKLIKVNKMFFKSIQENKSKINSYDLNYIQYKNTIELSLNELINLYELTVLTNYLGGIDSYIQYQLHQNIDFIPFYRNNKKIEGKFPVQKTIKYYNDTTQNLIIDNKISKIVNFIQDKKSKDITKINFTLPLIEDYFDTGMYKNICYSIRKKVTDDDIIIEIAPGDILDYSSKETKEKFKYGTNKMTEGLQLQFPNSEKKMDVTWNDVFKNNNTFSLRKELIKSYGFFDSDEESFKNIFSKIIAYDNDIFPKTLKNKFTDWKKKHIRIGVNKDETTFYKTKLKMQSGKTQDITMINFSETIELKDPIKKFTNDWIEIIKPDIKSLSKKEKELYRVYMKERREKDKKKLAEIEKMEEIVSQERIRRANEMAMQLSNEEAERIAKNKLQQQRLEQQKQQQQQQKRLQTSPITVNENIESNENKPRILTSPINIEENNKGEKLLQFKNLSVKEKKIIENDILLFRIPESKNLSNNELKNQLKSKYDDEELLQLIIWDTILTTMKTIAKLDYFKNYQMVYSGGFATYIHTKGKYKTGDIDLKIYPKPNIKNTYNLTLLRKILKKSLLNNQEENNFTNIINSKCQELNIKLQDQSNPNNCISNILIGDVENVPTLREDIIKISATINKSRTSRSGKTWYPTQIKAYCDITLWKDDAMTDYVLGKVETDLKKSLVRNTNIWMPPFTYLDVNEFPLVDKDFLLAEKMLLLEDLTKENPVWNKKTKKWDKVVDDFGQTWYYLVNNPKHAVKVKPIDFDDDQKFFIHEEKINNWKRQVQLLQELNKQQQTTTIIKPKKRKSRKKKKKGGRITRKYKTKEKDGGHHEVYLLGLAVASKLINKFTKKRKNKKKRKKTNKRRK